MSVSASVCLCVGFPPHPQLRVVLTRLHARKAPPRATDGHPFGGVGGWLSGDCAVWLVRHA